MRARWKSGRPFLGTRGGRIKRVQKYIENESFMVTYGDSVSRSACASSTNATGNAKQAAIAAWAVGASDCSLTARNSPECARWRRRFKPSEMILGGLQ